MHKHHREALCAYGLRLPVAMAEDAASVCRVDFYGFHHIS
jgi:hypothetical protein